MDTSRIQEIKFIIPSLPRAANLAMQAYPNKRIGEHQKWCAPTPCGAGNDCGGL